MQDKIWIICDLRRWIFYIAKGVTLHDFWALGLQCPIPMPWWKRYVDDGMSIVKKDKVDILFSHLNSVDPHIKFTKETPVKEGSLPFLNTKCSPDLDSTIPTSVFRKSTHTDCYLDWNSNHPISAKKVVIQALTYRAIYFYSIPQILAK